MYQDLHLTVDMFSVLPYLRKVSHSFIIFLPQSFQHEIWGHCSFRLSWAKLLFLLTARVLDFLIKLILLCAVGAIFYFQIFQKEEIEELKVLFLERLQSSSPFYLILAMLLVPVNWALETSKWLTLLRTFYHPSFGKAYQAVLAGVTVSLITPNRIGEYGGRVVFIPDGFRWQATISTLVGSLAQLISLLGFGLIAVLVLTLTQFDFSNFVLWAYFSLSILLIVLLFLIYFNLPLVIKVARKLPFWEKWKRYFAPLKSIQKFPNKTLKSALFFASLRYFLYFFSVLFIGPILRHSNRII